VIIERDGVAGSGKKLGSPQTGRTGANDRNLGHDNTNLKKETLYARKWRPGTTGSHIGANAMFAA
jgi:hypothetical protein